MEKYIKKIRTNEGDFQIDYEALANKPKTDTSLKESGAFADSKATGDRIDMIRSLCYSLFERCVPTLLTSDYYGDKLPDAGNPGRIFFKKVNLEE